MKKTISILLLCIQVTGLGGYQLFFNYFQKQASVQIVERLDGGRFSEKELIEIKIPYPLPYGANRNEYERYDGEIEMAGVHYNYVKRKMLNDTLYLLCIPNHAKNELNAVQSGVIAGMSDANTEGSSNQKSPSGTDVKPFTSEYNHIIAEYDFSLIAKSFNADFFASESKLPVAFLPAFFQPPRV